MTDNKKLDLTDYRKPVTYANCVGPVPAAPTASSTPTAAAAGEVLATTEQAAPEALATAERISCPECNGTGGVMMDGDCSDCNGKGYDWEPIDRVSTAATTASASGEAHPYHRDLAGLSEFTSGFCNGDSRLIACAEAAWYRCMARNHPLNNCAPSREAASLDERERIEQAAKAIYRLFDGAEAHPWVEGGNSTKQDEARRYSRAALAQKSAERAAGGAGAAAEDAARLDFVEAHPEMTLRYRKKRWALIGFTNYEYEVFKTAREAIDAARAAHPGEAPAGGKGGAA